MKVYLIGALNNRNLIELANEIRGLGIDVFDDWISPGEYTDDYWREYETRRGRSYGEALAGHHAGMVFAFDKWHLDDSDVVVLVLPCGKSAHLELGYALGQGKVGYVLFDDEPDRYDVMYRFADGVFFSRAALLDILRQGARSR